ncbi:MAG: hypothetical protein JXB36_15105 [Gammaproteobacteria bacterium]|nr:hypothetical protein [Gammaproteobacteria bacterium]
MSLADASERSLPARPGVVEVEPMWMSKPLYESLPFCYMAIGLVVTAVAFFVDHGRWQALAFAVGLSLLVGGLVLWLKRRDYRSSRSRTPFEKTL